ncbi:hypothetical protein GN956_G7285 [Arapaima gigas]
MFLTPLSFWRRLWLFLQQHVEVLQAHRGLSTGMAFWNGWGQVQACLWSDSQDFDVFQQPMPYFTICEDQGYLFYPRQPTYYSTCSKCRHLNDSGLNNR